MTEIKTLYQAYFDMSHIEAEVHGRGTHKYHSPDQCLRPDALKIAIREIKYKEVKDSRLLMLTDSGSYEWRGPWAPCTDFCRNEIDAVHMLRWFYHSTATRFSPEGFGGEEEMHKYQRYFAARYETCVKWLIDHGVKKTELWDPDFWTWTHLWGKPGDNPAPYRLCVP